MASLKSNMGVVDYSSSDSDSDSESKMASPKSNMEVLDYSSSGSDWESNVTSPKTIVGVGVSSSSASVLESNMASPKSIMGVGKSSSSASVLEGNKVEALKLPYISMEEAREALKAEKYTGFIETRPFIPPEGFVFWPQLASRRSGHKRNRDGSDLTGRSDGTGRKPYVCEHHKSLPSVPKDSKIMISGPGPIPFLPKNSKFYTMEERMEMLDILEKRRRFRETCGCKTVNGFYAWNQ